MGEVEFELRGGINAATMKQSTLTINTIVAIKGAMSQKRMENMLRVPFSRAAMFRRDWNVCAYCGDTFRKDELTVDHIVPQSRGGTYAWTNVVSSCYQCNHAKADRTPEEASMPLLYVPYVPTRAEFLILDERRILIDQMEYLASRVPEQSRIHARLEEMRERVPSTMHA
jgi:hypothetical protein